MADDDPTNDIPPTPAAPLAARALGRVTLGFTVRGTTEHGWRVQSLHGRERLNDLYTWVGCLVNPDVTREIEDLLGIPAAFHVSRGGSVRVIHGIVRRVEHVGTLANRVLARIHLAPAMWELGLRTNYRMFQEKTPLEIVTEVLQEVLTSRERSVRIACHRSYPRLEYCNQYGESDLDFVHRLLEEYSISYRFEQGDDAETLVLVDDATGWLDHQPPSGGPWLVRGTEADAADEESIRHFRLKREMCSERYVGRDFDWTHPARDLTIAVPANSGPREVFEWPARFAMYAYSREFAGYQREDAADKVRTRAERLRAKDAHAQGEGNITALAPGQLMLVEGHGRDAVDGRYLVTEVESWGDAPEELTSDVHHEGLARGEQEQWKSVFECVHENVLWRPPLATRRPVVHGSQTATVVGPPGEDIYTDEHGRVKVLFRWDREGRGDETSSCWIRVAQAWAGNGWGFVFIPRIGMEVIVTFLNGDPDRPLVVGCVYNGENRHPYPQPDNKTRSTLRTQSTDGAAGYNEFSFEDVAGGELVLLRAQRNLEEEVRNDHISAVTRHRESRVGGNEALEVVQNRTTSVKGADTTCVTKDCELHVDGPVGFSLKALQNINLIAQGSILLQCGASAIVLTPEGITLVGPTIMLRADGTISADGRIIKLNCGEGTGA